MDMIKIDDKLLDYLFNLARLPTKSINRRQKTKLKQDLSQILEYISQLDQVPTQDVEVFHRPYPLEGIGHDDQVKTDRCILLPATGAKYKGYLIGHRVIDKEA